MMRLRMLVGFLLALPSLIGCQYYEEYRNIKGDADIKEEKAELMKAHRLCLQKYENDPAAAKERCAPYAQAVQDIDRRGPAGK